MPQIDPGPEFCDRCDKAIGGKGGARCRCYDPVTPGPSPLAGEAEGLHPAGLAVARKLAREPFTPLELSIARNSVAAHGGAGFATVHGAIDGSSAFFVCRMLDALRAAGAKAVALDIRSEGGSVPAGLAIVRALERLRAEGVPTIANVTHCADSMASVIAVSCDYAVMAPSATMVVHEAQGGRDDHLALLRAKLLNIYSTRTLTDRATLEGYLRGGATLDAHAAWTHGFVDEVCDAVRAEEVVRAAAQTGGLWNAPIRAANSWRRHELRERQADAAGVVRCGPSSRLRGL